MFNDLTRISSFDNDIAHADIYNTNSVSYSNNFVLLRSILRRKMEKTATELVTRVKKPVREVTIDAEAGTSSSSSTTTSPTSSRHHANDLQAKRRQFMSQPSTVATRRQQAVCVRRAHKSYGPKNNQNVVLDGLNMTVPKGSMLVFF